MHLDTVTLFWIHVHEYVRPRVCKKTIKLFLCFRHTNEYCIHGIINWSC